MYLNLSAKRSNPISEMAVVVLFGVASRNGGNRRLVSFRTRKPRSELIWRKSYADITILYLSLQSNGNLR